MYLSCAGRAAERCGRRRRPVLHISACRRGDVDDVNEVETFQSKLGPRSSLSSNCMYARWEQGNKIAASTAASAIPRIGAKTQGFISNHLGFALKSLKCGNVRGRFNGFLRLFLGYFNRWRACLLLLTTTTPVTTPTCLETGAAAPELLQFGPDLPPLPPAGDAVGALGSL